MKLVNNEFAMFVMVLLGSHLTAVTAAASLQTLGAAPFWLSGGLRTQILCTWTHAVRTVINPQLQADM